MVVHGFDEVLARTDPFDLSQALERSVRSMPAQRVRELILDAHDRMGTYYRSEFLRLLGETRTSSDARQNDNEFVRIIRSADDDAALRQAFARLLKSNLRAIPIFGPAFAQSILRNVPMDRAVAIGEERRPNVSRFMIFAAVAFALLLAGAAGERVISNVRGQSAASPLPQPQAPIAGPIVVAPSTSPAVVAPAQKGPAPVLRRQSTAPSRASAVPVARATAAAVSLAAAAPRPAATLAPIAPSVQTATAPTAPRATPRPGPQGRAVPAAQGVATVEIPAPTPTAEPSAIDVSDMPEAYTDATPLPYQSAPPAAVPQRVAVKTPTPKPRSRSWFKRTLLHLDPFKPSH